MDSRTLYTIILILAAILYFIIAAVALLRRTFRDRIEHWLVVYLVVSGLWVLSRPFQNVAWLHPVIQQFPLSANFAVNGLLPLSFLFLGLSRSFLQIDTGNRDWWRLGVGAMGLLTLLTINIFQLPEWLTTLVLVTGWGLFVMATAVFTLRGYRKTDRQPLHRNRISYWVIALLINVIGDALTFYHAEVFGSLCRLLATFIATYAMLAYRLFDVRHMLRRAISYLITMAMEIFLWLQLLSYTSTPVFNQLIPQEISPYVVSGLTMLIAILFNPILLVAQQIVDKVTFDVDYDLNETLREYSMRVSNIVDLSQLEATVMGLISEAMEIQHGTFFLVDAIPTNDGYTSYQLHSVQGLGTEMLVLGTFAGDSIVAEYLAKENRPLTQYDIDLSPRFRDTSPVERDWLSGLGVEVFVPIYGKGKWLGLLGLGPKRSGDRYSDNDLTLLSTMADQTAVALENARLFSDLVHLNHEIKQAYAQLERANYELLESDKLKSAFIGVITHELRTPFATIIFALQLIEREGLENFTEEQRQQMEQLTVSVKAARTMVNNLVAFAGFLSKQGALHLSMFDFAKLVEATLFPLRPLAESKEITLEYHPPEIKVNLYGDEDRLADAIHHLVHNAIKFTNSGGHIEITVQLDDRRVYFAVRDNGIGIPADKIATLWDSFTQMADPLRRGVEGLGLGLALVKQVVTAHKGEVAAESLENEGSVFGFWLPQDGPEN